MNTQTVQWVSTKERKPQDDSQHIVLIDYRKIKKDFGYDYDIMYYKDGEWRHVGNNVSNKGKYVTMWLDGLQVPD